MLLENKVAVIYGGSGAIGSAVARAFAREGARLFLVARDAEKLARLAAEIEANGGSVSTAVVDASDERAVEEHARETARRAGRIDVTLNAVSVPHVQGVPFATLTLAELETPIHGFLRTNFVTAKAVAEHMTEGGVILTLSTPGARISGVGFLGYGVTCAGVETFSRILSAELGSRGIRVVCLRADAIPEALPQSYAREVFANVAARSGTTVEAMLAEHARTGTLLGRSPTLAQVASAAVFAASDGAGAMTAAVLNLSCGSVVD